jgi:hypothetical protein
MPIPPDYGLGEKGILEPLEHWPLVVADAERKFPPPDFKVLQKPVAEGHLLQIYRADESEPIVTLVFHIKFLAITGQGMSGGGIVRLAR